MTTMNNHIGLKGIFNLKFTNVKTGQIRELEFTNLILNSGLDRIAVVSFIGGCVLGSGSSTPVATDTSITSILGSSTTLQAYGVGTANTSTPPYWCSYYWTFRFIEGVATGNISQVAMAFGTVSAGTTLFSLALVKDSGGTPITITKLADEVLDVTYTLQLFCPSADVTGTISISGVNYDYVARPASAASWAANNPISASMYAVTVLAYPASSTLGTQLTIPSGNYAQSTANTYSAYTAGTFYKDLAIYWDLNNGNVSGGIRCIHINAGSVWQIQYSKTSDSSAIPKDATKRLTLNVRFSWGRV